MLLDGIEEDMSISSTGLQNFINLSGDILSAKIQVLIKDVDNSMNDLMNKLVNMPVGSRLISQGANVSQGDTVSTTVTLKNIKL